MRFLCSDIDKVARVGTVGGKAANLFRLIDAGFNVPAFVVITQEEGLSFIPKEILKNNDHQGIRKAIQGYQFPAGFVDQVFGKLRTRFVAVRSSAADEDGGSHSFAGQFESVLYVTPETLESAIRQVWLSAYAERVQVYREMHHIASIPGIAVIIQEMIDAESSGVGFGVNPANGNRKEKVISAVYGLGEGIVSGDLNADNYYVTEKGIRSEITVKDHRIVLNTDQGHGTRSEEVPEAMRNQQALTGEQISTLASILDRLHRLYKRPQDIEFAVYKDRIYLLQVRPVTTTGKIADPDGEYIVWDNSNIIESYPGLTSPLTFSFIRKMYEAVYIQFTSMMGVTDKEIQENASTYAHMLGLLDGRVYYNLRSWYKLLSLLPGYSLNAGFMEKMMGVKEKFVLDDHVFRTPFRERLRVLRMIRLMVANLAGLPAMRRAFTRDFELEMQKYEAIDLHRSSAFELMRLYKDFEQTLLRKWKAPLVNDFYAMIYYGTLQKLITRYGIDEQGHLHNDLLCGARDIVSTQPVLRCEQIAALIREDEQALAYIESHESQVIWEALLNGKFPRIKQALDAYIRDWGDRTVGELKLEAITYRQEPALLINVIKGFIGRVEEAINGQDVRTRAQAEQIVSEKLKGKFLRRLIFNHVLRRSRELVSYRENLRYARTRGFGMVRRIFIAMGEHFYAEGLIDDPRDVFWLKQEEVFDHIQGTNDTTDLRALITLRKDQYSVYAASENAERIVTRGIVYLSNSFRPPTIIANEKLGMLKGIGCCPGRIRAHIRVVHDPHSLSSLNGDILVTASTDPGWVTLFPSASAILVERGSLLSHSAIVSREMGKPCIVGITGLLQHVKTGDLVEMDGSTGEIYLMNHA